MSPWIARLLGYVGIRLVDRLLDRAQPPGNSVDADIIGGAEAPRGGEMTESRWQYFTVEELQCRGTNCCGGQMHMDDEFMRHVVALRRELGFPFIVTSAYRCPAHNAVVSSTGASGVHTLGVAIDIKVSGLNAMRLAEAALSSHAFTGIGINQKGPMGQRFIHLDSATPEQAPRPTIFSY